MLSDWLECPWEDLDFKQFSGTDVVLAACPAACSLRDLLARASAVGARLHVIEDVATRPLQLEDLFERPLRDLDWARIGAAITGRRVLITGGGGSIGAQLARQVAALKPKRLTLLDSSELNLFNIGLELPNATLALADVRDRAAIARWFANQQPDIVFHTAALKQVPLVEMFPSEGVLTNIGGLRNVAEAAHAAGADLVFVSTDKAVAPSGLMGATKRLGELYCIALDQRGARRAIPLRLGNVLGSAGSVAPVFSAQIAAGKPLTVTDPEVTRYFMSIPQAAKALLQACGAGLEQPHRGIVFTVDMGNPLAIVQLAQDMIRLAGKEPDRDVPIVFTGLRPGEKLHEQLLGEDEWREACDVAGVVAAASPTRSLEDITRAMDRLVALAREGADEAIADELFRAIAPVVPTGDARERAVA